MLQLLKTYTCWSCWHQISKNAQHRFTAPTSQKFRCTPVLHDIKMPLANASAVWQNVGHKLHWQEPVWKVVFHRQSFFRTLFFISLPNHPLCTMWTRAELPAAVQKICEPLLHEPSGHDDPLRWLWSWRHGDMTRHGTWSDSFGCWNLLKLMARRHTWPRAKERKEKGIVQAMFLA